MKTHTVLDLLVFTCFLVIGYTFNLRYYQPAQASTSGARLMVTFENQASMASLPNGQRSILLLEVNSLTAPHPKLDGIWLATYLKGETRVQLLPIFPSSRQPVPDLEAQMAQTFKITRQSGTLKPDQAFLDLLIDHNYWWSGYIVYDEAALARLLDLTSGMKEESDSLMAENAAQGKTEGQVEPHQTYSSQIKAMQLACRKLVDYHQDFNLAQLETLMPAHLLTDLDTSQVQAEYEALEASSIVPACHFPTLDISRIEP
jgi:hypothetical protein